MIYFPASKAIILGRKAYDMLLEVRNFLDTNLEKYIVIQGHSSSEGSEQYNYILSEQRAEAVKNSSNKPWNRFKQNKNSSFRK